MLDKPDYEALEPRIRQLEAEKAELERAVKDLRERLDVDDALFDRALNPVLIADDAGRYIGANPAALRFLEIERDDLLQKTVWDFAPAQMLEDQKREHSPFLATRTMETVYLINGRLKVLLLNVIPVRRGERTILYGIGQDITEPKRLEKQRAELEQRLFMAEKADSLGRMAGAVAHHFNNQLAVVQGNLELALEDLPAREATRALLSEAMKAANRSSEISTLMLTYLGQSAGKGEPLNLSAVCRQQVPLLREALPEGIALETDLMDIGPVVLGVEHEMHQVLTHLVANAAEAIGDRSGKMMLATRVVPAVDIPKSFVSRLDWEPTADIYACLELADTGCGIDRYLMNKIFDPFFTTKSAGRGLGLAVVMGIVKAYDGAVGVESTIDEGSTFRVYWPVAADAVPRRSPSASSTHHIEKGGAVLLVEDQAPVRQMAEAMLGRLGYAVLAAANSTEALELFDRHREAIGCVITDLSMPGMDGWQVLAALRKRQPGLPVILSSGYDETRAMGRDDGEQPDAFLHKPYSMGELKKALEKAWK